MSYGYNFAINLPTIVAWDWTEADRLLEKMLAYYAKHPEELSIYIKKTKAEYIGSGYVNPEIPNGTYLEEGNSRTFDCSKSQAELLLCCAKSKHRRKNLFHRSVRNSRSTFLPTA